MQSAASHIKAFVRGRPHNSHHRAPRNVLFAQKTFRLRARDRNAGRWCPPFHAPCLRSTSARQFSFNFPPPHRTYSFRTSILTSRGYSAKVTICFMKVIAVFTGKPAVPYPQGLTSRATARRLPCRPTPPQSLLLRSECFLSSFFLPANVPISGSPARLSWS